MIMGGSVLQFDISLGLVFCCQFCEVSAGYPGKIVIKTGTSHKKTLSCRGLVAIPLGNPSNPPKGDTI